MIILLPAAELRIWLRDETASLANTRIYAQPAAAVDLISAGSILVSKVVAASGCSVTDYTITYPYHVSDQVASGNQQVHITGIFTFKCTGTDQYLVVTVPGIQATTIETISPYLAIDVTLSNIASLVSFIINNNFCNPFGYRAVSLLTAFWQFVP
jgi:hypothetical protein